MADKIANDFFDAVSYLINKKIEAIQFDKTKTATIVEDDQADKGIYTVTEDHVTRYTAYSAVTEYKVDDTVLVTIPQDNYENQKMIIGKAVSASDPPVIYTPPFASLVDVSSNLITTNLGEFDIWANGYTYKWPAEIAQFPGDNESYNMQCIWDSSESTRAYTDGMGTHLNLTGYSRIGLQAQFATYLSEYETVLGNYGLALQLYFKVPNLVDGENTFSKFVTFDSSEFFGNIYSFDSYRTQEIVYNLTDYQNFILDRVKLFIYQRVNFKDKNGEMIEAPQDEFTGHNIAPNISFKDFYICLGVPAEGFESDTIELICNNNNDYYKTIQPLDMVTLAAEPSYIVVKQCFNIVQPSMIIKTDKATLTEEDLISTIRTSRDPLVIYDALIQIAKIDTPSAVMTPEEKQSYMIKYDLLSDETYNILKQMYPAFPTLVNYIGHLIGRENYNSKDVEAIWLHKDESLGTIARVEEGALPLNYTIRWYRYELGVQSPDAWAGAHWKRFYGCRDWADVKLDYCITGQELIQAAELNEDIDIATDEIRVIFRPNINNASEQLKAILLYNEYDNNGNVIAERFIAASKPIIFYNNDDVRSQATIIDLNTLAIKVMDEERGRYFLYNRADDLPEEEANEIRTLVAVFDPDEPDVYKKHELEEFSTIEWTFPVGNTMIIPATDTTPGAVKSTSHVFTDVTRVGYFINDHLDRNATNNTIQLKVFKDGLSWEAECTLVFGTAGTSGSDYTLVLTWKNVNKVLDVTYPGWDSLKGEVALQDRTGKYITIPTESELQYDWLVSEITATGEADSKYGFVVEDKDLYYPIFTSRNDACFEVEGRGDLYDNYRQSDNDTYGGFYYYLEDKNSLYSKISNIANGSDNIDNIGYFDLVEKKFVSLTDSNVVNSIYVTLNNNNIEATIHKKNNANDVKVSQFYRKRRNKINLTDKSIVNQNETFFKSIYETVKTSLGLDENIYTAFLNNINLWPKKDGSHLNIQNQDNILNLGVLRFSNNETNTIDTIGESLVNFLNQTHSNFETELISWMNPFRLKSYHFYSELSELIEVDDVEIDKILVELIFNLKNIYEYVLDKLQSSFTLNELNSLDYYFYEKDSKQFKKISNYSGGTAALFNNEIVIYKLNNSVNNANLDQYEFPKPRLEYRPLNLLNTTAILAQKENPYDNSYQTFDVNIQTVNNMTFNYLKSVYKLLHGKEWLSDNDTLQTYLTSMCNHFKEKDKAFRLNTVKGIDFVNRPFWQDKMSLINDFFTIKDYYNYLTAAGQESRWRNDYPEANSISDVQVAFCLEFLDNDILQQANFGERFSITDQGINESKFQSLIYTDLFTKDDLINTNYKDIDEELRINKNNLSNYYKNTFSKIESMDNNFYLLKQHENNLFWWDKIYQLLCNIDTNNNFSLNNFINNYFYNIDGNYRLKLKQIENLPEESGIWVEQDGFTPFVDKLREPGYDLINFYNEYLKTDATGLVQYVTSVNGTENLLEICLEGLYKELNELFDINEEGLLNKIKSLILNNILSVTNIEDQAKSYDLLKTPTTVLSSNLEDYNNYLVKTNYQSNFPFEPLDQYLLRSLQEFNINTHTPLSDTFKIYQNLYGTLNNALYYNNYTVNSNLYRKIMDYLIDYSQNEFDFIKNNNEQVPIDSVYRDEIIYRSYFNEIMHNVQNQNESSFIIPYRSNDGQKGVQIYEDGSKYTISLSKSILTLKGAFKDLVEETIKNSCEAEYNIQLVTSMPDGTTLDNSQEVYYLSSINNFNTGDGYSIFPYGVEILPQDFIDNLQKRIGSVSFTIELFRSNKKVFDENHQPLTDDEGNQLYTWNRIETTSASCWMPTRDTYNNTLSFLRYRWRNNVKEYYWLYQEEHYTSDPYQIGTTSPLDLNFVNLINLITPTFNDLSWEETSQLLLWTFCLNKFKNSQGNNCFLQIKDLLPIHAYFIRNIINEDGHDNYFYHDLREDFSQYINADLTDTKKQNLANLILNTYLYPAINRTNQSRDEDFSLFYFKTSNAIPYDIFHYMNSGYSWEVGQLDKNTPEKILYNLLLKNPIENISYIDLSKFLYTNSSLFWKYISYKKDVTSSDGLGQWQQVGQNDNQTYSYTQIKTLDDYNPFIQVFDEDANWPETLNNNQFKDYTIVDSVSSNPYIYYNPASRNLGFVRPNNKIAYYILFNLEDIRQRVIISNVAPMEVDGISNSMALREFQFAKLESQDNAFRNQSFSFISRFYNSLSSYIKVNTQTLDRSNASDLLKFKMDMYEFLSNEELSSKTLEAVDIKFQEYFENYPISYLINISNLNEREYVFEEIKPGEGLVKYNMVLVDSVGNKLYNLNKIISNISSEAWLYELLNLLKYQQIKINPSGVSNSWNKIGYLESPLNGYKEIIITYFTKDKTINTEEKINFLIDSLQSFYLDSDELKVWGTHRSSGSFNSKYKILYKDTISDLSDVLGNSSYYISTNNLVDIILNIFLKNTIYEKVSDDEEIEKYFNYYNSQHYKAFVNIGGNFVLDPYDDWIEEETYYEPIQVKEYACKIPPLKFVASKVNNDDTTDTLIEIYPRTGLTSEELMKSISILKITLTKFGNHDLVAYFPIPLRNGTQVEESGQVVFEAKYLVGATEVRYTSGGTTEYNKNPYRLFVRTFNNIRGNEANEYEPNESQSKKKDGSDDITAWNWGILIPSKDKYNNATSNFIPRIINRLLEPSPVYIPNLSAYAVLYWDRTSNTILWNQPILSYEDNYPSTTLNGWNGQDILTDKDSGTIVASAFAAGKKERDNTFTGLMLGDWSRSDTDRYISKQTGIYGFYHGSMAYAFKDDGTGFIGRDGRGRIYFNGQNSTIYSSNWLGNEQLGMLLDIDDGVIQLNSMTYDTTIDPLYNSIANSYEASVNVLGKTLMATVTSSNEEDFISGNTHKYITLSAQESHYPLAIGTDKILTQRKFRVAWDGTTYIQDGVFSGVLHAKGGILDNDFIVRGTLYGGTLLGGTLYASGLYANQGQIGPWIITPSGLINKDGSTVLLGNTPDITFNTEQGEQIVFEGKNNPYTASIITNKILISTDAINVDSSSGTVTHNKVQGSIGYVQGFGSDVTGNYYGTTDGIGILSSQKVIIQSDSSDIGIKACAQLFLEGGKTSNTGTASAYIQVNHPSNNELGSNSIILSGSGIEFYKISADKQKGIYARFA